jgi:hypothetical protein
MRARPSHHPHSHPSPAPCVSRIVANAIEIAHRRRDVVVIARLSTSPHRTRARRTPCAHAATRDDDVPVEYALSPTACAVIGANAVERLEKASKADRALIVRGVVCRAWFTRGRRRPVVVGRGRSSHG